MGDNIDESSSLLGDRSRRPSEGSCSVSGIEHTVFEPRRIKAFKWLVVVCVIVFVGSYCSWEIIQLSTIHNNTSCMNAYTMSNVMLTVYLFVTSLAIVIQSAIIVRNLNCFRESQDDIDLMLIVMLICGLVSLAYCVIHFVNIATLDQLLTNVVVGLSEFIFGAVLTSFVILCVCYNVLPGHVTLRVITELIMLLSIGGCVMLFMKKAVATIHRDLTTICVEMNPRYRFIYDTSANAERKLIMADNLMILIVFIFLIDLSMKMRRRCIEPRCDSLAPSCVNNSLRTNVQLLKWRWPALTFSMVVIVVYLSGSYVLNEIINYPLDIPFKEGSQIIFLSYTIGIYVVGIFYCGVYYFTDHCTIPRRNVTKLQNDAYFNNITSAIQLLYSCSLFWFYVWIFNGKPIPSVYILQMALFVFLLLQVSAQVWYINSAIRRKVTNYNPSFWNSALFPPLSMALVNMGFLYHNVQYLPNGLTMPPLAMSQSKVFVILSDIVSPIVALNRLHAMVFFIKLSFQQWYE